ncbi:MerR family transcriptional regulator [Priestia filamentosa]|uniref:MerR family transcriptional regulator n=1 Tax=Priestia filamentosa TaxID=1402861 RepID=UPI001C1DF807|nr:MerR family transcriptional regulator [Priestia filamentosa]
MSEHYTLKELIELCGVSEDTIRYYEKIHLLPLVPRKSNGHRVYDNTHKETLLMIKCLKKAGMSLNELKPLLLLQQNKNSEMEDEWNERLIEYQKKIKKQQMELQELWDIIEEKRRSGVIWGQYA